MKPRVYTGGCQCGAVRYRIEGDLSDPHLCHCRMCQKAAGNYFMPLGGVSLDRFEITRGEPAWFNSSDPVRRGFCRNCGTPLFFADKTEGNHISVTLGSLDDPSSVPPVSVYGTEARMPFLGTIAATDGPKTEDNLDEETLLAAIRASNRQHPDHDTESWPPKDERP